jgi:hypothetical protein
MEQNITLSQDEKSMETSTSRRSFLRKGLAVGGAGAIGAGLLSSGLPAFAQESSGGLTKGDVAILRFLSAAEILETDLWQQYNELGGIQDSEVPGGSGNAAYTAALAVLDADMAQYIHDNTEDARAQIPSTWISFAPCRAAKRPGHRTSDGSPTSCNSLWIPVIGRSTAAAQRTPISVTRSYQPSRVC